MATDLEYVRFLISDVNPIKEVFSDAEVSMVLEREGGVKIAAAVLMERIADNEVLIAKKIVSQDLQTDGPAVAAALRASADRLRGEWLHEQEDADGGVYIVEYAPAGYEHAELTPWPV